MNVSRFSQLITNDFLNRNNGNNCPTSIIILLIWWRTGVGIGADKIILRFFTYCSIGSVIIVIIAASKKLGSVQD